MAKKVTHGGGYKLYKTYSFKDKDPIIDQLRTLIQDQEEQYSSVSLMSGVSTTTLYNWFHGETKRPQFASVMAVARSLGYDLVVVKREGAKGAKIIQLNRKIS